MKAHKFGISHTGFYMCEYGGWNCNCCSPSRQDRPKARRSVRRKLKEQDRSINEEDMIE